MLIQICKAKLNKAVVTACEQDFSGSIAVDAEVLDVLNIYPYEKVLVVNRCRGHRFETYVVPGKKGEVVLQGGAALLGEVGDTVGFLCFALMDSEEAGAWKPKIVELNTDGGIIQI